MRPNIDLGTVEQAIARGDRETARLYLDILKVRALQDIASSLSTLQVSSFTRRLEALV